MSTSRFRFPLPLQHAGSRNGNSLGKLAHHAIRKRAHAHWRLHIDQLTPEDTAEYLRYRMKRAGCDRDVFTQDAVQMLHEAATGGMRDLDRLATGCLREAARKKRKLVERDLLPRVLDRDGLERDR